MSTKINFNQLYKAACMRAEETITTASGKSIYASKPEINSDGKCIRVLVLSTNGTPEIRIEFMAETESSGYGEVTSFARVDGSTGKMTEISKPYGCDKFEIEDWNKEVLEYVQMSITPLKVNWNEQVVDVIDSIELSMTGIFVIPNRGGVLNKFLSKSLWDRRVDEARALCEANGETFDPETDKVVEVWMYSDTPNFIYDNLEDHHPHISDKDGNRYDIHFPTLIPKKLLEKMQEGVTTMINIPSSVEKYIPSENKEDERYNDARLETIVKCKLTPAQLATRYRRFGKFEDVVQYVTN